jgi:integrase
MAQIKITKRVVDAAELRETRYIIFDSLIPGFGLRVMPSGAKSYVFEYRPGEGGRRTAKKRVTIGKATEFTADQARKEADRLRAIVKTGGDPAATKARQRAAATVTELANAFLSDHVEAKRKERTHEHYRDILDRIVKPALGSMKAKDVKRADIARLHLAWKNTPFQANRVLAIVASMYSFGGLHGFVPEGMNPTRGVEKYDEEGRERLLSGAELVKLGEAIRLAETNGLPWTIDEAKKTKHVPKAGRVTTISPHAAAALRLLMFTGARLREILHLRWNEVDLERGLLLLPDSKTGKKTVVLSAPALQVLNNLPRIGAYVIAGDTAGTPEEKPRSDLKRPWAAVREYAGLDDVRLHDLRHLFASTGVGGGLDLFVVGKLLGHAQASTTQRYSHLANSPLKRAADAIGFALQAAIGESITPAGEDAVNVVSIKEARKG